MSTLDHLERIVTEELSVYSDAVQQRGRDELQHWLQEDNPEFCMQLKQRIRDTLEGEERGNVLSAFRRIRDRILGESRHRVREESGSRRSADLMRSELMRGYRLVRELGRGVVTFGSARSQPGERWYELSREFCRECGKLLGSTTWSGAGPGFMQSSLEGAKEADVSIGGIKIILNNSESSFEQPVTPVLPPENVAEFGFFGPRKVALVDAGMREHEHDRTAFVFFPGGFGTLDEFFEVLTLKQLKKLGTQREVPILLMNYDGFYGPLLEQLRTFEHIHTIKPEDLTLFTICSSNREALNAIADHYDIAAADRQYTGTLTNMDDLPPQSPMNPNGRNVEPQ